LLSHAAEEFVWWTNAGEDFHFMAQRQKEKLIL
jgi:hypothetical protein